MRSIGARLVRWYALTATGTLACLFIVGYQLLENHLVDGLDLLNSSEFEQIKAQLGRDYQGLHPSVIEEKIGRTTDSASVLFFIDVHGPQTNRLFMSRNLNGHPIPDVLGEKRFNVEMDGIGELRVGEFRMAPYDVMVATPLAQVRKVMASYVSMCLALLAAMLCVSVITGFALSRMVLRPVRLIRETANRIRSDHLTERIPVGEVKDELSDLARLLNQMFDRLESSFEQIRRFTADASHELKTPLSLIRLHAEKLLDDESNLTSAQREGVQVQLEELARLNQMIEELLFLSRADAQAIRVNPKPQQPGEFLASFAQDASALVEHRGLSFEFTHEGNGLVAFEEKRIRQVLLNLLANAINASPAGGRIVLRSTLEGDRWRVTVEDGGRGLTAEQRSLVFERFVRFNPASNDDKGSGLGLAICRSIVGLHRGRIFATPGSGGKGLRVVIEIPSAPAMAT